MTSNLADKSILFLSPGFYAYDLVIIRFLEKMGAKITCYMQRPKMCSSTMLYNMSKILKIQDQIHENYQRKLLRILKNKTFDYVFLIHGACLKEWFIARLRQQLSDAKFIMYQWDPLSIIPNFLKIMPYFDEIYSFDRADCDKNPHLKFRPLFFRDDPIEVNKKKERYDLAFVGSLHSNRLQTIRNIEQIAREQKWLTYFYLYVGPGLRLYLQQCLNKNAKYLHIKPLSYRSVQLKLSASKVILDFHNPVQSGLTIRTLEALAQGKKIMTSNHHIKDYELFSDENIRVMDTNTLNIDNDFIQSDFNKIPDDILNYYSLHTWINEIFCC